MKIEFDTKKLATALGNLHPKATVFGRCCIFLAFIAVGFFFLAPLFAHTVAAVFGLAMADSGPATVYTLTVILMGILGAIVATED